MLLCIVIIVVFVDAFPDEIVSQGEAALQIYLSSCSEGTAVTVFLRVDVVGRDGAGKTSLTKSLTLQEFDPNELSTRGVVFDPKCKIIVKEACDWTTPLTSEHYRDMYDKNMIAVVADRLNKPEVKEQYFRSKEEERPRRKKQGQKRSRVTEKSTTASAKKVAYKTGMRDIPLVDQIDVSSVEVSDNTEQLSTVFPDDTDDVQQHSSELATAGKGCDNRLHENELDGTMPELPSDRSSLVSPVSLDTLQTTSTAFPFSTSTMPLATSLSSIIASTKPQSSVEAPQVAVPEVVTSIDAKEQTAGTEFEVNSVAKEIREESSVTLPIERKRAKTTEVTTTNMEPSTAVRQCDQQSSQNTKSKGKRKIQETMLRGSKHSKETEPTAANAEPSAALEHEQNDQQLYQSRKDKGKKKRKTPYASRLSVKSDNSRISPSRKPMTDTRTTLPETVKKRVSKFLRDKESLEKAQKEMMVTVLDYAGQHVFYATHHLCLSKAGFYYVVFDASQPLDGKTPSVFRVSKGEIVHIPLFDNETNFDRLLEWMSAIHIMEPDHSHHFMLFDEVGIASPAMFLVGTHADKLREQPGLLERQDELMRNKLEGTVLAKHIIWASKDRMCFYVDNTVTDPQSRTVDPQVCLLRQMTEEVARKVAQHHKLPLTWLKFEQEVRDVKVLDKAKKTVSVEELLQLAEKATGIKTKKELEVLLHYLSNRAVVLYHPKALKSGEEEVVLDVEWLISQLEKVITIHTNMPPKLENDVRRSREKGIMTAYLIKHQLSDSGSRQPLLMSLMRHFDLLCQYGGNDDKCLDKADDQHDYVSLKRTPTASSESKRDVECKAYFMPCLLQKGSILQSAAVEGGCKTVPLILKSDHIRIPKPLFYRLLTRFATRFPRLPQLFANVGYFHVYHNHKLEISLERYCLQMMVFTSNKECLLPAVCFLVRDYVTEEVDKAKHPGMSGLELKLGFYLVGSQQDFVSLEGYPALRKRLHVESIEGEIDPPFDLKFWYPEINEVNHYEMYHVVICNDFCFLSCVAGNSA